MTLKPFNLAFCGIIQRSFETYTTFEWCQNSVLTITALIAISQAESLHKHPLTQVHTSTYLLMLSCHLVLGLGSCRFPRCFSMKILSEPLLQYTNKNLATCVINIIEVHLRSRRSPKQSVIHFLL